MLLMPVITTLCTAGVAFYFRFLSALWKEMKAGLNGFFRRCQPGLGIDVTPGLSPYKMPRARGTLRLIEVKPNAKFEELRKDVI
jgi:hypothetical protein